MFGWCEPHDLIGLSKQTDWNRHMSDRLIPLSAVLERICISKTDLYRRINRGEFPKPVPIGRHRIAFVEAEVANWISSKMEARDKGYGADVRRARALHAIRHGGKIKSDLYS